MITLAVPPERAARVRDALEHLHAAAGRATLAPSGELTGPRALLRELLIVAIDEAAEALRQDSTRLLRGTGSAPAVRASAAELGELLDLLEGVDG